MVVDRGYSRLITSPKKPYLKQSNLNIRKEKVMHFNSREEIIALTPHWKGERLPDGRPKVADRHLKALHNLTLEEVWKPIFVKGYESQFEGRLQILQLLQGHRSRIHRWLVKQFSSFLARRGRVVCRSISLPR